MWVITKMHKLDKAAILITIGDSFSFKFTR